MSQSTIEVFGKLIEKVSDHILDFAMVLAAVGVIAMALLELLKALSRARRHYHRWQVQQWIGKEAAYRSLLTLTVGEVANAGALFDQPIEKMMGQIQSAANIAIEFPENYFDLFTFLTTCTESQATQGDMNKWAEYIARASKGTIAKEVSADQQLVRDATQARARLDHLVARKLDAFQTTTAYQWALWNQTFSVAFGTFILWYVMILDESKTVPGWAYGFAIIGGMVAPFAKDVVSALSGLRATRG
jgi:hypothetical protein